MKTINRFFMIAGFCACSWQIPTQASSLDVNSEKFQWKVFGATERFTTQNSMSGTNLSTMINWNPFYKLNSKIHIEGQVGASLMKADVGNFIASRLQTGLSFHHLFSDSEDQWVPEFLVGAENWAVSEGGTYFVGSANLHYRLPLEETGLLNYLDSIHVGYQWLADAPSSAQQVTAGIRIVFGRNQNKVEK